jgi:hypothetical protein
MAHDRCFSKSALITARWRALPVVRYGNKNRCFFVCKLNSKCAANACTQGYDMRTTRRQRAVLLPEKTSREWPLDTLPKERSK